MSPSGLRSGSSVFVHKRELPSIFLLFVPPSPVWLPSRSICLFRNFISKFDWLLAATTARTRVPDRGIFVQCNTSSEFVLTVSVNSRYAVPDWAHSIPNPFLSFASMGATVSHVLPPGSFPSAFSVI